MAAALASGGCLEDSVNIDSADIIRMSQHTTAMVDLTGDGRKEFLAYYLSFVDSSSCIVFSTGDTLTKLFENRFSVDRGDWGLYIGDYNRDCILDFTVSLPNTGIFSYAAWDEKEERFHLIADTTYALPDGE